MFYTCNHSLACVTQSLYLSLCFSFCAEKPGVVAFYLGHSVKPFIISSYLLFDLLILFSDAMRPAGAGKRMNQFGRNFQTKLVIDFISDNALFHK